MPVNFIMPSYLLEVLNVLEKNHHQAWVVGGAVRDMLIGKEPHDYDVVTTAELGEILQLFDKALAIGEKHGTALVFLDGRKMEVTRCKTDLNRGDKHKKERESNWQEVLQEDLYHRDFTINAIALDQQGNLFDPFGGIDDIENKIIRSPEEQAAARFKEDPLRMLRAVRFCTVLKYQISSATLKAIEEYRKLLSNVSWERIRDEFVEIILSDPPNSGIEMLVETGLIKYIIPEILPMVGFEQHSPYHIDDVFSHSLKVLEYVPARLPVRLAALLHDIAKPETFIQDDNGTGHFYQHQSVGRKMTCEILERLKFDRFTINKVERLVGEHMSRLSHPSRTAVKRLINRVGKENAEDLFCLQKADILGGAPLLDLSGIEETEQIARQVLTENDPLTVQDLAINGHDLIQLGLTPGPGIGQILQDLLEIVIQKPDHNQKEMLLDLVSARKP